MYPFILFIYLFTHISYCATLSCSVMSNSATPWTIARQAPLSLKFSRQEYWSGLPGPPPGDRPNPGIKPRSPALQSYSFTLWAIRGARTFVTTFTQNHQVLNLQTCHSIVQCRLRRDWVFSSTLSFKDPNFLHSVSSVDSPGFCPAEGERKRTWRTQEEGITGYTWKWASWFLSASYWPELSHMVSTPWKSICWTHEGNRNSIVNN